MEKFEVLKTGGSLSDYIILYCEKPAIRIRKAGRGIKFSHSDIV